MIRAYEPRDFDACVQLLMDAYNGAPWENHWTEETASRHLKEFLSCPAFVGFTALENGQTVGALFAHRQTWWTQDEVYVDELFVHPLFQGKGHGKQLLQAAETHCRENGLAGVVLLTNRHMPAKAFYDRNGYVQADHVIYMYKVV